MKKRHLLLIIPVLCVAAIGGLLYYTSIETEDIEVQEETNQLLAEEYLVTMTEKVQKEEHFDDFAYEDNRIFSYYSESNAWGKVDCVLEIPKINLRQSIFTGTIKQIEHDLRNWLPVTARTDYILGETQYCIYTHNPKNQSIQFSKAQEKLKTDDYMVVTQENMVYLYEVVSVFPEWREVCTKKYVDNMDAGKDMLYIFTCGRGDWLYRNVVIEGKIHETYQLKDWMENKEAYIKDFKEYVAKKKGIEKKDKLVLKLTQENENILVDITTNNYKKVTDCSIGVFDQDGYLIEGIENPISYTGESIIIPKLPNGTYCVGIYENNTEYKTALDYEIKVNTKGYVYQFKNTVQNKEDSEAQVQTMQMITITSICVMVIAVILIIIRRKKTTISSKDTK